MKSSQPAARALRGQPLIACGICRVSLEKQVSNYSPATQKSKFIKLGEKYGATFPPEYLIDDDGYSGSDFSRPSIEKAMKLVREGAVQAVAWPHIDRFAREVEGGLRLIREFREAGAEVMLGDLGWYTDEKSFRLQVQIHLVIAEMQKEDIREKSMSAVEQKIKQKVAHGGHSPYGYRFVTALELATELTQKGLPIPSKPENRHEPVPAQLAVIRLMGELALSGLGLRGITRELNARGIPGPKAARWNPATIGKLLKDETYCTGIWHYNKRESIAPDPKRMRSTKERHTVKSSHKLRPRSEWMPQPLIGGAVITRERFDAVRAALAEHDKSQRGRPVSDGGRVNLLRSLAKCRLCGAPVLRCQRSKVNGPPNYWFGCTRRDREATKCNYLCEGKKLVKADLLEEAVWRGVCEAGQNLSPLVKQYRARLVDGVDSSDLDRLREQEKALVAKMKDAANRLVDETSPEVKEVYADRIKEMKLQLDLVRRRVNAVSADDRTKQVDLKSLQQQFKDAFRTRDPEARRELLNFFVKEIRYALGEAEIVLRIPVSGETKCKWDQPPDYIYLPPITVEVRAA